jgi:hypothetical protein
MSRRGGTRDPMLARTGFGDDALGTETLCQQRLAHGVVDLVRTRVRQIFALEPDLGSPTLAQCGRMGKSGWAAHPRLEFASEFSLKFGVVQIPLHAGLQTIERGHQGLGNIAPAEGPETAANIGRIGRRSRGFEH